MQWSKGELAKANHKKNNNDNKPKFIRSIVSPMNVKNYIKETLTIISVLIVCFLLGSSCKKQIEVPNIEIEGDTIQTSWEFSTPWPFDQPSIASLRASEKKVFAHYFTQFPTSIDNKPAASDYYQTGYLNPNGENGKHLDYGGYLRDRPLPRPVRPEANWMDLDMDEEVRLAVALGLDGFACDLLSYQGYHLDRTKMLLEAASRIDAGFKIMLMPDIEVFKSIPDSLTRLIKTLAAYPAAYRLKDGRLVVAPYNAQGLTTTWWTNWLNNMKNQGINIAFVPVFQNWSTYAPGYSSISYGMSDWGWRSPKSQTSWRAVPAQSKAYASVWMMPVAPQDMRPKSQSYYEAANSQEYRVMWENAILGNADWVQLITWNDFSEHTCITPSSGTQYSFYDLTAYYTTWFKTGTKPEIKRDVLYYFYRLHSTSASNQQSNPFKVGAGSDLPLNEIELLAFLVSPGTLEIEINGKQTRKEVQAGMNTLRVPLANGVPIFRLLRENSTKIVLRGAFEINNTITYQNLLYFGGSNSRLPVTN